jgi:hypothetical protein
MVAVKKVLHNERFPLLLGISSTLAEKIFATESKSRSK